MPELPTVEIHSPKDASKKWIINAEDFDAEKHTLWSDKAPDRLLDYLPERLEHVPMRPSVPDFVLGDDGAILSVNIINPQTAQARKEIPYDEYDPGVHRLWSTHRRFQ